MNKIVVLMALLLATGCANEKARNEAYCREWEDTTSEREVVDCMRARLLGRDWESVSEKQEMAAKEAQFDQRKSYGNGAWITSLDRDPITGITDVTLSLVAYSGVNSYGESPTLIAGCKNEKTKLYVSWGEFVNTEGQLVTDRIGNYEPETKIWSISTDNSALFRPVNMQFLERMMLADEYVVMSIPYGKDPITAKFDVRGLAAAAEPLRAACSSK